jgi:hypothetical protein
MVVEHYVSGPEPVYARVAAQGRLIPDGLRYVDSWVVDGDALDRCYQLMETDDRDLLERWLDRWHDLVRFEVYPVISSPEAATRVKRQGSR